MVGGVFAPVYLFLLPSFDPRGGQKFITRFREIDYLGALLSTGTLVSVIMAINFGGTLYAWNSGQVIALFVIAAVLVTAFALQQRFSILTKESDRIFPVHFLRNKEAVLLFVLSSASNAGGYIPLYYIPLLFQFTRGDDALKAAVRLLPLVFLYSFTVISNGAFMSRFGLYQPWYVVGSALLLVGGALSCQSSPTILNYVKIQLTSCLSNHYKDCSHLQYIWLRGPSWHWCWMPGSDRVRSDAKSCHPIRVVTCYQLHAAR